MQPAQAALGRTRRAILRHRSDGDECSRITDRVFRTGQAEIHGGSQHSAPNPFYWPYAVWPILTSSDDVTGVLIQATETTAFQLAPADAWA
jgi:hypothetical protein